jgi:hypothetical protein
MIPLASMVLHKFPAVGGGPYIATANLLDSAGRSTVGVVPTILSNSITVTVGQPVIVAWMDSGYGNDNPERSLTGAGQTWVKIMSWVMSGDSSAYDRCTVWKSDAAVGGSGALSFTNPSGTDNSAYSIVEFIPEAGRSVTLGTLVSATQLVNATSISVGLAATTDYWFAIAMASKAVDGTGQAATPRAGWAEISDDVGATGEPWYGAVETQMSPQGGDTSASATWAATANIALFAVPLTVS